LVKEEFRQRTTFEKAEFADYIQGPRHNQVDIEFDFKSDNVSKLLITILCVSL